MELKPLSQVTTDSWELIRLWVTPTTCWKLVAAAYLIVWATIRKLAVFEKSWKSDSKHYHPKFNLSGQSKQKKGKTEQLFPSKTVKKST